jgi:hypothetical protein
VPNRPVFHRKSCVNSELLAGDYLKIRSSDLDEAPREAMFQDGPTQSAHAFGHDDRGEQACAPAHNGRNRKLKAE